MGITSIEIVAPHLHLSLDTRKVSLHCAASVRNCQRSELSVPLSYFSSQIYDEVNAPLLI